MDTLLHKDTIVAEWCDEIITRQSRENHNSLVGFRDRNRVVKHHIQQILDHLKGQNISKLAHVQDPKIAEALRTLIAWLKSNERFRPSTEPPLTDRQLEEAFSQLYLGDWAYVDRKYDDPVIPGQNFALFSFLPTVGAQPDADGVYGFLKIRGTFDRAEQAEDKARELIQYFTANTIKACKVGTPVPVAISQPSTEAIEIPPPKNGPFETDGPTDLKYQQLIQAQSMDEQKQIQEIYQNVEKLKEDVTKNPANKEPMQVYLELLQKMATCAWTYSQAQKTKDDMKSIILSDRLKLEEMDQKYPHLQNEYRKVYDEKNQQLGLDQCSDDMALGIRKYFGSRADLDF
ncbi:hypothetical protein MIV056L [Invertebrate iridescent virus 3]|uniref:Uncharacterized protein 056L n=1 Tax=Invertebrate iridescent virus 3 TaxID=345201 RepID=VF287_IIV3|nr:hypothetical protein MIV056L [Invertebrate iridescent virus 3]Q197A4.1 RecName: Full=Uncharacterized protein 056L [Invertebrate iridescent virus 3]ABF82086.1 hypothetical protein MIV056L [Invertebrate iridescent virus 3]